MFRILVFLTLLYFSTPTGSYCAERTLKAVIGGSGIASRFSPDQIKAVIQNAAWLKEKQELDDVLVNTENIKRKFDNNISRFKEETLPEYEAKLLECGQKNYTQQDMQKAGCGQSDTLQACSEKLYTACISDSKQKFTGNVVSLTCEGKSLGYIFRSLEAYLDPSVTCTDVVPCKKQKPHVIKPLPVCKN